MKSYDYIYVYNVMYIVPFQNPKEILNHEPVTDIMVEVYKRSKLVGMACFECPYDETGEHDIQQENRKLIDIMKKHGIPVEKDRVMQNAAVRLAPLSKRGSFLYFNPDYQPPEPENDCSRDERVMLLNY